jgi:hypothetical protein
MAVDLDYFKRMTSASAVVAAGAADVTTVTITARNPNGSPIGGAIFDVFLSDSATGDGLTATSASGTVVNNGAGQDLETVTAKKHLRVQAGSAGTYVLEITDTANTAFYVFVVIGGRPVRVATLAAASYGA